MRDHLLLVDSSNFAYRAFYGSPPRTRKDGTPVHAIIGFMAMLHHMLRRASVDPPDFAAAVFDAGGKTFRHKLYPPYKAQRVRDKGLTKQLPMMRDAADALGLAAVECKGFEADDLIAALTREASLARVRTTIVSVDKDLCQLAKTDLVEIADPVNRTRMTADDVTKKFGVRPEQIPDLLAIAGDASDNIPGVKGCGEKTAVGLVRRLGGVTGLIHALDRGDTAGALGSRARRGELRKSQDDLRLFLKLTRLDRPIKLPPDFPSFRDLVVHAPLEGRTWELLRSLEAEDQYERIFGDGKTSTPMVIDAPAAPFEWYLDELASPGQTIPHIPQCGYYQRRLVAKGVLVPARIYHEPDGTSGRVIVRCELNGATANPMDQWGYLAMSPILKAEYDFMLANKDWAKKYDPDSPVAAPHKRPDLHRLPAVAYTKPERTKK